MGYNATMKTPTEIEIKKVRKQLKQYGITQEEKEKLREMLHALKKRAKMEQQS